MCVCRQGAWHSDPAAQQVQDRSCARRRRRRDRQALLRKVRRSTFVPRRRSKLINASSYPPPSAFESYEIGDILKTNGRLLTLTLTLSRTVATLRHEEATASSSIYDR